MRKRTILSILAVLLLTQVSTAASYIVVDEPELQDAVVLVGDLYDQGQPQFIIGQGQNLILMDKGQKKVLIDDIPGKISALALGDVNGDLRNNLVVGTQNVGALYFYTEKGGVWERQGQPQYLWDTIRSLEVYDFNNDGWGDVVVLTKKGEIQVLLSFEGKLYPFWKSPPNQVVTDFKVLDVDQNGFPDLIYTLQSGYIGILTWDDQEFTTLWENYPWGLIESLVILPNQTSPEWLVVTSQKMLYGWRWQNGEVASSRHFHANELGEHLVYIPGQGLLSFSQKTGASLFELKTASIAAKWRVPGVFGQGAFYHEGAYYFHDLAGRYHRLVEGSGQWRILVDTIEVTSLVDVWEHDGKLYYNLADLGPELGFVGFSLDAWHFLRDGRYLKLRPGSNLVECDGLKIPLSSPILEKDGLPYGSSEVFPLFGWSVETDASRQTVVFLRNWGWWL